MGPYSSYLLFIFLEVSQNLLLYIPFVVQSQPRVNSFQFEEIFFIEKKASLVRLICSCNNILGLQASNNEKYILYSSTFDVECKPLNYESDMSSH